MGLMVAAFSLPICVFVLITVLSSSFILFLLKSRGFLEQLEFLFQGGESSVERVDRVDFFPLDRGVSKGRHLDVSSETVEFIFKQLELWEVLLQTHVKHLGYVVYSGVLL